MKLLLIFLLLTTFISCGDEDESEAALDEANVVYDTYKGPGSHWTAQLGTSTFILTESDAPLQITGPLAHLPSGFLKLTVGNVVTGTGPTIGQFGYGFDIPGLAFFLKPIGGNLIAMLKSGSCPTSALSLNWIFTQRDDTYVADTTKEIAGVFTTDGSVADVANKFRINGSEIPYDAPTDNLGGYTCSNGIVTLATGVELYLTQSNGALVRVPKTDPIKDSIVFASQASVVTSGDIDQEFFGLMLLDGITKPVKVIITAASMTIQEIDIETGADVGTVIITSTLTYGQIATKEGFLKGVYDSNPPASTLDRKFICTATANIANSNKAFITCAGQSKSTIGTLFSLVALQK